MHRYTQACHKLSNVNAIIKTVLWYHYRLHQRFYLSNNNIVTKRRMQS